MSVKLEKFDLSIFTPLGRRLSKKLIPFLPRQLKPDHVTAINFGIWLLVAASLYLAGSDRAWFVVAACATAAHWLLDELDGELARARSLTSERGFFLDFYFDAIGGGLIGFSLANAGYTLPPLVTFYTLLYLNGVVLSTCIMLMRGRFLMGRFGPSEVQASLVVLSLLSLVRPGALITLAGLPLSWFDLALLLMLPICFAEWLFNVVRFARDLEPARHRVAEPAAAHGEEVA